MEDAEGPGAALRTGREAKQLSIEQVAQSLNLSSPVIEALENQEWSRIAAPVFVYGYIRAYARLLGLDAASLVAGYERCVSDVAGESDQLGLSAPRAFRVGVWKWVAVAAAVLLAVLAVTLLWRQVGPEAAVLDGAGSQPSSPRGRVPSPSRHGAVVGIADGGPESEQGQEGGRAPPTLAQPTQEENALEAPGSNSDKVAVNSSAGGGPTAMKADVRSVQAGSEDGLGLPRLLERTVRVTPEGDAELSFEFSSSCWVEVRTTEGDILYSVLGQGGERLRVLGDGPFYIVLGYAPGVALTFNGKPIRLAQHTQNQVASLVLGQ